MDIKEYVEKLVRDREGLIFPLVDAVIKMADYVDSVNPDLCLVPLTGALPLRAFLEHALLRKGRKPPLFRFIHLSSEGGSEGYRQIDRLKSLPKYVKIDKRFDYKSGETFEKVMVIDEVGMLELKGKGWAKNLEQLVQSGKKHLLIVVRDEFSEAVLEKWNIQLATVFETPVSSSTIENKIFEKIS